MPDSRRAHCRECGRHRDDVGELSWSGKCVECGPRLLAENVAGLHLHAGYPFERWRRAMAACVGGVILDDTAPKP